MIYCWFLTGCWVISCWVADCYVVLCADLVLDLYLGSIEDCVAGDLVRLGCYLLNVYSFRECLCC